jgi:hypothetical protein
MKTRYSSAQKNTLCAQRFDARHVVAARSPGKRFPQKALYALGELLPKQG